MKESLSHLQYTLVVISVVVTENHHYVNKINRTMTKNDKRRKAMMVVGGLGTFRVFSKSVELVTYKTKYRHSTTWPSKCTNKVFIESRTPSVTHIPVGVSQPVNPRHCASLWYALLTSPIAASPWARRPTRVALIRVSFLACFYWIENKSLLAVIVYIPSLCR